MRNFRILFLPLLFLLLSACSNDDSDDDETVELGEIRIINLVPDSPLLRLNLDGVLIANVSFGQSSEFIKLNGGTFELKISHFDADGDDEIELFLEEEYAINNDRERTLIITGALEAPVLTSMEELLDDTLLAGSAELKFFSGFATHAIDIYLSSDPDSTSINGLSPINLSLAETSDVMSVDSGDYRLLVTQNNDDTVIYDSGSFNLGSGTRRLFTANNYFGPGGSIRMMQVSPTSASTMINESFPTAIRIANMIADIEEVDIYIDGTIISNALGFEQTSEYFNLTSDAYTIDITPLNDPSNIIYTDDRQLIAGESRTLVLSGLNNSNQLQGRFILDDNRPISSAVQLRIINAAPGAGNVDAYMFIPGQVFDDTNPEFINMTLLTNGVSLLEGRSYDLVFTRTDEETIVLGPERLNLVNGGIYSVILTDANGGGTPSDFVLLDDFLN